MENMTVRDVATACGGVLHGTADSHAQTGRITVDTRTVEPGDIFAAFRGERVDGHDFIGAAFDRGASCCIAERVPEG